MKVTGVVESITSRDTQYGKMYDVTINGKKYGAGKYAPKAGVGDAVEFIAEQNGKFLNIGRNTLKQIDHSAVGVTTETTASSVSRTPARAADTSWDERQATISKQAAINTAIEFTRLAVEAGAVKLPSKEADKFGVLEAIVLQQASRFHEVSTGRVMQIPEFDVAPAAKGKTRGKAQDTSDEADEFADDDIPF
jgi:hypothetical protein